jgi:hypothetical protein
MALLRKGVDMHGKSLATSIASCSMCRKQVPALAREFGYSVEWGAQFEKQKEFWSFVNFVR